MSANEQALEFYRDDFAQQRARMPGADRPWLSALREQALAHFVERGFPSARDEAWKYTNVRPISKRGFEVAAAPHAPVGVDELREARLPGLQGCQLVFVNGCFAPALSDASALPAGVRVESMADSLASQADELKPDYAGIADYGFSPFTAWNTAFASDGAYLHLKADTVLEAPLYLLFLSTAASAPLVTHPRVLIVAESGAKASVVEHYAGLGEASNLTNAVTEIALERNANLTHYKLQRESLKGYHVASVHVRQHAHSEYASHNINLGGRLVRNDIHAGLVEEGAAVRLNGYFQAQGRQHVDNHTRVDHQVPHTFSDENYKGVLSGHGRGVFNGKVYVHPDAQKTEAHQSNKNLVLSDNAEMDTKPELEIYADDVQCSHGATVGQLDESAAFYLRSRGLDEATVRGLLTFAFAEEVLSRFELAPIHNAVQAEVAGELLSEDTVEGLT